MALKRKCGFESICTPPFRKSLMEKGHNLWRNGHVLDLEEIQLFRHNEAGERFAEDCPCSVRGLVLPQTSVSNKPYEVTIKLDKGRKVADSVCACKAGLGYCKHKAAVLIAVNEEDSESKTSLPQTWGKPSNVLQQLYKKGHSISQLIKPKVALVCPPIQKKPPNQFLTAFPNQTRDNALTLMLKAEHSQPNLQIVNEVIRDLVNNVECMVEKEDILNLCTAIFKQQECSLNCEDNYALSKYLAATEVAKFYNDRVCCTVSQATNICLNTVKQSECKEWFIERKLRISSTAAHRIKTRKEKDFDSLTPQLLKNKVFSTPAMRYSMRTEAEARKTYVKEYKTVVSQLGLVINFRQPWLCCSPDGIISTDSELILLEIKCPYTFKNKELVNWKTKECHISYLYMKGNDLRLKPSHSYFTQIQFSLYITQAKFCYLYIFSSVQQVRVHVSKDEKFIAEFVPKVSRFFFIHYLPAICDFNA